jgi:tetratricopeptide (TPR) repeat protein
MEVGMHSSRSGRFERGHLRLAVIVVAAASLALQGCEEGSREQASSDTGVTADRAERSSGSARAGVEQALPDDAEARSLLGEPLFPPPIGDEARARMEEQLAEARRAYDAAPDDADAIIWLGRRTAYPARYVEAIEIFSEGIEKHPDDARMYRHRGHRYITTRRLAEAVDDLERAAELVRGRPDEVEPDGMPNPYGIPTSTLQSNIWYHLALARYLQHDFEGALADWREAMEVAATDDMRVATADWLYMTLRRLGRDEEAATVLEPFHADMEILENHAYHRRLLMYRGELEPAELLDLDADADPVQVATYGYGVANWHLYNGNGEEALRLFRRILEGPNWAAFGYIAAEAELAAR